MERNTATNDEALSVLEHQRETWRVLIERIRETGPDAAGLPAASTQQTEAATGAGETLSVEG